jgi:hypothetical protein
VGVAVTLQAMVALVRVAASASGEHKKLVKEQIPPWPSEIGIHYSSKKIQMAWVEIWGGLKFRRLDATERLAIAKHSRDGKACYARAS